MGNCYSALDHQGAAKADTCLRLNARQSSEGDLILAHQPKAAPAPAADVGKPKEAKGKELPCNSDEEVIDLDQACPNAVTNPDTDLILNMLDPENGPAAGLPYQVHYLGPPRPPCEKERLATVHALGKIKANSEPDPEIATILKLVAGVFKAPAALCALFDEQRVFISEQEGNVIPCGDFPWRWTLCGWSMAFKNPQVLVIQDTLQDARFRNNLKVTQPPHVRFYCGAPLVASNGQRLGTLCFADVQPRKFDQASCIMMNNLSELVVRQLEKDIALKLKEKDNKMLLETYKNLQRAVDCYEHSVVLLDTSEPGWKVVYANASWTKQTGLPREKLVGGRLCDILEGTDGTQLPNTSMLASVKDAKTVNIKMARIKDPSVTKTVALSFKPAGRTMLDESTIPVGVPSFLELNNKQEDVAHRFFFMTVETPGQKKSSVASSRLSPCGFSPAMSLLSMTSDSSDATVVPGLELGHLLGRGSFGWVYYGTYYGTSVAVKVIDEDVRRPRLPQGESGSDEGAHFEARVAHELRHPNIVATLAYATHTIPQRRLPELSEYGNNPGDFLNTLNSTPRAQGKAVFISSGPNTMSGALASDSHAVSTLEGPRGATDGHTMQLSSGQGPSQASTDDGVAPDTEVVAAEPEEAESGTGGNRAWAVIEVPAAETGAWETPVTGEHLMTQEDQELIKACQMKFDATVSQNQVVSSGAVSTNHDLHSQTTNNIVQTWMVMEYCDKGCVQDAIDRGWLLVDPDCLHPQPNMVAILATAHEIASAMQYLHVHDVVHGDLSGWNVMLSSSGATGIVGKRGWTAKVADFGLARTMDLQSRITTRNYGTITHMPPELLKSGIMSKAVDVYSFGVLLWQMYTGSRPWSGLTHAQIIMKVAQQQQRLKWEDSTPSGYRKLAEDCMAYDMDKRPTFKDIVATLDAMRSDVTDV